MLLSTFSVYQSKRRALVRTEKHLLFLGNAYERKSFCSSAILWLKCSCHCLWFSSLSLRVQHTVLAKCGHYYWKKHVTNVSRGMSHIYIASKIILLGKVCTKFGWFLELFNIDTQEWGSYIGDLKINKPDTFFFFFTKLKARWHGASKIWS